MKRFMYLIPLAIVLMVGVFSIIQLKKVGDGQAVNILPSVLINTKVPPFELAALQGSERGFSSRDLIGQVSIVNIFGSWCVACQIEHPYLLNIKEKNLVPIYGINWREKSREAGPAWLAKYGDPYTLVGDDPVSEAAIAFGVSGAPETFIVDKEGVIRYKQIGPISTKAWDGTMWPIIQELRKK